MFPGGLDPKWFGPVYDGVMQNLMQHEAFKRQMGHYAALQQALQNTQRSPEFSVPPGVISSALENAVGILNSPEFQTNLKEARQTSELAAQRFGTDGLIAAQQISSQRFAAGPGLEQAVSRIQSGQADELLSEAAELAASPEVSETIENADKDEILRLAEERRDRSSPNVVEPDLEASFHTAEEAGKHPRLSKEKLLDLFRITYQLWLLLGVAGAAALVATNPALSLATLVAAHNGLAYLLQFLEKQLAAQDDDDK